MRLDAHTRANLELFTRLGERGASLLQVLDATRTPMGVRLLRARLQDPLTDIAEITRRLDSIEMLLADRDGRRHLRDALAGMRDLERLVARCVQRLATPRDLGAVRDTCAALEVTGAAAARILGAGAEITEAASRCRPPAGLRERLDALLCDELPAAASDGGAIRAGADEDLDSMRAAGSSARTYLAALEASADLAERHGPHPAFGETRAAAGKLQPDLWDTSGTQAKRWSALRQRIAKTGLRNSLLIAVAPTSTIASIGFQVEVPRAPLPAPSSTAPKR